MRASLTLRSPGTGLFGLLVFVAAVLLFPLAHSIDHGLEHEHGPAGAVRLGLEAHGHGSARSHEHEHGHEHGHGHEHEHEGDHDHDHDADEHRAEQGPERDSEEPVHGDDPRHGHGSLEHFGIAALALAHFPVPGVALLRVERARVPEVTAPLVATRFSPARPRGPPT